MLTFTVYYFIYLISFTFVAGFREKARFTDFDGVLPEELSERVKEAAEVSMGCEISETDLLYMQGLCQQVNTPCPPSHSSHFLTCYL